MGLKAPFPWFGGKRKVAQAVWNAIGDVQSYVEPFAGSLAVLLERPAWHNGVTETVNDADQYLSNFWRALAYAPDEVARYADWPVNECAPAGTLIATPCGDIPIEKIFPGMVVWGEKDGQVVPTTVVATKRSEAHDFVNVGGLLVTGNHPVWTREHGYLESEQLTDGLHVAMIDCPINELDLSMLYLGHESAQVGNLCTKRSENRYGAVCRRHLSSASPIQRTSFSCYAGWKNLSGLLDSVAGQCGHTPNVSSDRAGDRRWLAGQRKILDCPLPGRRQINKFDGWRGWHTRVSSFRKMSEGGVIGTQGRPLSTRPNTGDAWQESYARGCRKDSSGRDRARAIRCGESQIIPRYEGKKTLSKNSCSIGSGTYWQETDRRTQAKNHRHNGQSQSGASSRNRTSIRIYYSRIESVDGKRGVSESSDPQGLLLQRESSPVPVAVYNFQTETHNYFANRILVHNCDLFARHLWLVNEGKRCLIAGMDADPEWYDAKIAGWWLWGICQWIGSGWCSGTGPHTYDTQPVEGDAVA